MPIALPATRSKRAAQKTSGGPFYDLQRQLGLLREDTFRAGSRALLFVGLAWGVPLILSLIILGSSYIRADLMMAGEVC